MADPTRTPEELARLFHSGAARFMLSVADLEQLPPADRPECAFIGRSNVGKSSLFNALFGHSGLARVSNTPGRTQQLNFFDFQEYAYLVDVPGYGYAEAPKAEVAKWQDVLSNYLRGRTNLRRAYLLIDARHGIKANDVEMMKMLDTAAVTYQIVITKIDKISATALAKIMAETETKIKKHAAAAPLVLSTSSEKSVGIENLRASVFQTLYE